MYSCPAQCSISRAAPSGSSTATQIDPRQRWCQLLVLSSQWLASQWFMAILIPWVTSGRMWFRPPGSSTPMSEPAPRISCRKARSGSEPGNPPSSGKVSVRIALACA